MSNLDRVDRKCLTFWPQCQTWWPQCPTCWPALFSDFVYKLLVLFWCVLFGLFFFHFKNCPCLDLYFSELSFIGYICSKVSFYFFVFIFLFFCFRIVTYRIFCVWDELFFRTVLFQFCFLFMIVLLLFSFQNCPFSDFPCSELLRFGFSFPRSFFLDVYFSELSFLFSELSSFRSPFHNWHCFITIFQNCPSSDCSCPELSFFRIVLFGIVLFLNLPFQNCPFQIFIYGLDLLSFPFSELSFFWFILFIIVRLNFLNCNVPDVSFSGLSFSSFPC